MCHPQNPSSQWLWIQHPQTSLCLFFLLQLVELMQLKLVGCQFLESVWRNYEVYLCNAWVLIKAHFAHIMVIYHAIFDWTLTIFLLITVLLEWNQTRPILCTKHPNLTMLFYYLKVPACHCPHSSTLELNGALKWGTVWTSISIGIETRKGQTWIYVFY